MAKATAVGNMILKILNGISPLAAIGCIFFLGGAWKEFGHLKDTVEKHCAEQASVAEKLEIQRVLSWDKQREVDRMQDDVWGMFGKNLGAMEAKIDTLGTDMTIIKGILMAVPDAPSRSRSGE